GSAILLVRVSAVQRRGEGFAPMHWTDRFASTGPIGRIVSAVSDPISGQPGLKATAVKITPVPVSWWGLLLRRSELVVPGAICWSRVPVETGHAYALAGREDLPGADGLGDWASKLLGASAGAEMITYTDAGRGVFRCAKLADGQLDACLFLAPSR